jgi:hypothetical protein
MAAVVVTTPTARSVEVAISDGTRGGSEPTGAVDLSHLGVTVSRS